MLLDRYLVRETCVSFAMVAIILTLVFFAYSLTRFLADAAGGLLNAPEVARLTAYKAIIALEVLLPLAFFFGVIVACGKLNLHGETTAMRACGLSLGRLYRPLIVLAIVLALVVAVLSISVRPETYGAMFALKDYAETASELDRIKAQRFYLYEEEDRSVYIEDIRDNGKTLRGIFIRTRTPDGLEVISAPRGFLHGHVTPSRHRLVLQDANIFRASEQPPDVLGRFDELTLALRVQTGIDEKYRTKSASTGDLLHSQDPDDRAELQWRLSTPVSTVLLALAALMLIDHRPRQGRFARLPLAIGIYALYYNFLGVARTWVEQEIVPSLWWAPGLLALALLITFGARRRLSF